MNDTEKQLNDVTKAIAMLEKIREKLIAQRFKELEKPANVSQ